MSARVLGTVRATDTQCATGLLAFITVQVDQLILDGVQLRRTRDGRHVLSWPNRRDAGGRKHAVVRPVDDAARVTLEREVLGQLGADR